jgi:hypothetical protein
LLIQTQKEKVLKKMFVENDLLLACQNTMMRNEKKRERLLQQVSTCPKVDKRRKQKG